ELGRIFGLLPGPGRAHLGSCVQSPLRKTGLKRPLETSSRRERNEPRFSLVERSLEGMPSRMTRYVAFLRGVSPVNASMPALKRSFEEAGFSDVQTVLTSGNVVFSARAAAEASLERKAEKAMRAEFGHSFVTIVRPTAFLQSLVETDPFAEFALPSNAKRVVT